MKLFEYQAKELFVKYGIPVPKSALVERPEGLEKPEGPGAVRTGAAASDSAADKTARAEAGAARPDSASGTVADAVATAVEGAVEETGCPCAVKAQVLRGGRGKAGLIKLAKSAGEAQSAAEELFAHPEGVPRILIEEAVNIKKELYLSVTVDPLRAEGMVIACAEGGVEI